MARRNYNYEKRQKELAKQKKKEEKRQRKLQRKQGPPEANNATPSEDAPPGQTSEDR